MTDVIHTPALSSPLPSGWRWSRLQDVCTLFDCPHSTSQLASDGPYIVRSQDIRAGVFSTDKAAHVSEQTYLDRTVRAVPSYGDLLFSREGTYFGIAAEVPANIKVCLGQRMVLFRPSPRVLDFQFLKYWINSPIMTRHMRGFRDGSVAERLNVPTIKSLAVILPPLDEQRFIAKCLSILDQKIELNRSLNQTLEATARVTFKSWFVDFDPVRTKGDSQQSTVISEQIAKLFPTSFYESPVGNIPSGWQVRAIGELTRVVGGSTPRTEEPSYWQGGQIAWATPKDLASLTSPVLLDTERHITKEGLGQISSGLLPKGTVLLSSRAPIGYLAISEVPVAVNQGFIALVCDAELSNYFVLNWIRAKLEEIRAYANGTTFMEISKANFRPLLVAVPPRPLLVEFARFVSPLYERLVANLHESETLIQIRDSVLPKVLLGDIRLKEAGKIVEANA